MNKPILAVDIDGVLADHLPAFWGHLGRPENPHVYSLYGAYPSISKKQIDVLVNSPDSYFDMQPMPGALAAMAEAAKYWEIVYVTDRPRVVAGPTECWLRGQEFPPGVLYMTQGDKVRRALLAGARFLIDDNPAIAKAFAEHETALVFQDPAWPYGMHGYGDAVPVSNWGQARFFLAIWRMGYESE